MGNSASCLTADGSAEGPASHTSTRDYLAALSAPELVEYCEEHGLSSHGSKAELVERLLQERRRRQRERRRSEERSPSPAEPSSPGPEAGEERPGGRVTDSPDGPAEPEPRPVPEPERQPARRPERRPERRADAGGELSAAESSAGDPLREGLAERVSEHGLKRTLLGAQSLTGATARAAPLSERRHSPRKPVTVQHRRSRESAPRSQTDLDARRSRGATRPRRRSRSPPRRRASTPDKTSVRLPRPRTSSGRRESPPPVSYTHLTLPTICSV